VYFERICDLVSSQCSSAGGVMPLVLFSWAIFSPWPAPLQNTNQDTAKPRRGLSTESHDSSNASSARDHHQTIWSGETID